MRFTPCLLAATLAVPALAADVAIDDFAPRDAVIVMRINDWNQMVNAIERTPAWEAGERDDVRDWIAALWDSESVAPVRDMLDRLDFDPEDFPAPSGSAGMVVWGSLDSGGVLYAIDFGDEAETVYDLMLESAELGEKDGEEKLEFDDVADHEIMITTQIIDLEAREARIEELRAQSGERELEMEEWQELWELDSAPTEPVTWYSVSADGWIVVSDHRDRLVASIDAIDGAPGDSLAGDEDLEDLRSRVDGAHADFVLLPSAINRFFELTSERAGLFLPPDLLGTIGLDQFEGVVAGLRFDSDDGQASLDVIAPATGRDGLFSLIGELNGFDPPAFVPVDSPIVTAAAVRWNAVLPFLRDVVQSIPEAERAQMEGQLTAFSLAAAPILQSLGEEVVSYSRVTRPFSPASETSLTAIAVANEAVVSGAIAQYGQMMGLQARDFLGSQIFEAPAAMGAPFALGLGRGWAFVGEPEEIENAFRRMSDEGAETIGDEERFAGAVEPLEPRAVSYMYSDLVTYFEYSQWIATHAEEYVRGTMTGEWVDEEMISWVVDDMNANPLFTALREAPEMSEFRDALGPLVMEYHMTDDAFTARVLIREPGE